MKKLTKTSGGIIYPVEKEQQKPIRKYETLEIEDEEIRQEVKRGCTIINLALSRGCKIIYPTEQAARKRLFHFFAKELLGQDCEFEEYC